MALSIANVKKQLPSVAVGGLRGRLVEVTFDNSYPTGGESFTADNVGLAEILYVGVSVKTAGYVVVYDYANSKLKVFGVQQDADAAVTDPLDEEDDTADLSALVVRLFVLGI